MTGEAAFRTLAERHIARPPRNDRLSGERIEKC